MLKEFGQDLKKLRELKGISITEISAESRINTKFLHHLENGKFDFQPETYVRSFIKAYARSLNENENQILNDYDKAKAGFYVRRKFASEENKDISHPDAKIRISVLDNPVKKTDDNQVSVYSKSLETDKPDYMKPKPKSGFEDTSPEFSNRSVTQKILLGILILAIAAGIYFLVDYLNHSGEKKTDVKPKSFNEISSEYENKISNKIDSTRIKDSLKTLVSMDSLILTIKAVKDIKIKLYIDEQAEPFDEYISAKDSLVFGAKEKFRFSANTSQNVDLYLNGKYLKKSDLTQGTSIKNLIISKEGIQQQ